MKNKRYTPFVFMVALLLTAAGCNDNQLLNSSDDSEVLQAQTTSGFGMFASLEDGGVGIDEAGVDNVYVDVIENLQLSQAELDEGYTIDITGYVGFLSPATGNPNPQLQSLTIKVNDEQIAHNDGAVKSIELSERGGLPGREFSDYLNETAQFTITSTGSYSISVLATFTQTSSNPDTESFDEFEVELLFEETIEVEFPAAPAIASRVLEANDIAARYGNGRNGGNYIADVAQLMDRTDFLGEPKELWEDGDKVINQAYWDAVWNYLRDATGEELPNAPHGYPES
jgi:hypothetical protein